MALIQTLCSIASVILAIITVFFTYFIPEKIKWEQLYTSLLTEYMSYDFAVANQSIIEFFYDECKKDINLIKQKSEEHYTKEVLLCDKIDSQTCLHFQRRLLTDFYWLVDTCAHSFFIGKKRVSEDFTRNDSNIIKIVYWMNKAVDESEILYKDIKVNNSIPHHKAVKGINRNIVDLSEILRKSKHYVKGRW